MEMQRHEARINSEPKLVMEIAPPSLPQEPYSFPDKQRIPWMNRNKPTPIITMIPVTHNKRIPQLREQIRPRSIVETREYYF